MIELYQHGSSVCVSKVRLVLEEKELEWKGHYVDILKGEQFTPEFRKLNPKSLVPVLVHDNRILTESTVICEYLEDVFPEPALRPADPYDRARMRLWTKYVDEIVHPLCADITFTISHRHTLAKLGPRKLDEFLNSTPPISITPEWHERKKEVVTKAFEASGIKDSIRLYDNFLQKMEDTLKDAQWLAGDAFSLADTAVIPYVTRLDMMSMSEMWTAQRPNLTDWFKRAKSRPSYKPALRDWCPDDLVEDLATNGAKSWPTVKEILATA